MKEFKVPGREDVSPANQAFFDGLTKAFGFVPNIYATLAWSENGLARYLAYQNTKTSLSNKEKEAVNLVVSEVHGCRYCQSAHTAVALLNGFTDEQILSLRSGKSSDSKLNTLVALAKEIAENKGRVKPGTLNAFYAAGYNDGHVVDLILQVSDKVVSNYLHNLTQIPIDFPVTEPLDSVLEKR